MSSTENAPATPQESRQGGKYVAPFTVELGDERNRTITVAALGLRLRGHWAQSKLVGPRGMREIGSAMNQMPEIPGLRLAINPKAGKVRIYDPLEDDAEKLNRINQAADNAQAIKLGAQKFSFVPSVEHDLNQDKMKTLVIEVVRLAKERSCRLVEGSLPTLAEAEAMAGRELYDPMSNSTDKPKYVDGYEAWENRHDMLAAMGARK